MRYIVHVPKLLNLKAIRESKFLTQRELAARSKVGITTIVRLERGQVAARFSTIKALAAALDVEPQELVGE